MGESRQVCPICNRPPGERHKPECKRSAARSRLDSLNSEVNIRARRMGVSEATRQAIREYLLLNPKARLQAVALQGEKFIPPPEKEIE